MRLSQLVGDFELLEARVPPDTEITGITSYPTSVTAGNLYICIRGMRHDGHLGIGEAEGRGAAAVIVDDAYRGDCASALICRNTRAAAAHLWNRWYENPTDGMKVIAVTGTNGKTTTAAMIHAILTCDGRRAGLIGTLGARLGNDKITTDGESELDGFPAAMTTPDPKYLYGTIAKLRSLGADSLVFEASSHALALHKTDALIPDVAVFTNLSPEHLDFHGTMENYLAAKARLFENAKCGVINADDASAAELMRMNPCCHFLTCTVGWKCAADMAAVSEKYSVGGVSYICTSEAATYRIKSPMTGEFTVYNSLLAASAAAVLGISPPSVQDGIMSVSSVDGRLENATPDGAPFHVIIDYAHTPRALESVLKAVRVSMRDGGRLTAVFGCGGDRDMTKRGEMGRIAAELCDRVIVTSDNPRNERPRDIINMILAGIDDRGSTVVIGDRREAIAYAIMTAAEDEVIVLAGKGHERYEITASGKKPFDERSVIAAAWALRSGKSM